jgi:hypothetical protein
MTIDATWRGILNITNDWHVLQISRRAPGFGLGYILELGYDNTRPDESLGMTERRIAQRFDMVGQRGDLIIEVLI